MKEKIVINCQCADIKASGGAGKYVAYLANSISNSSDLSNWDVELMNFRDSSIKKNNKASSLSYSVLIGTKNLVKPWLPPIIFNTLRSVYLNSKNSDPLLIKKKDETQWALLHEVTNYGLPINIGKSLRNKRFSLLSTFLDVQDYFFPDFFTDEELERRRVVYSFLKQHCTRFIAISEHTKSSMIKYLGIPPEKIKVIYLGADNSEIVPDNKFEEEINLLGKYFIYPAKFWHHKNHKFLFKCIAKLKDQMISNKFKLLLCGGFTDHDLEVMQNLLKHYGIKNLVEFKGFLTDNQLNIAISRATFLLFPSLFEGFGMPTVEAMGRGCPVICSNAGALPEVCGDAAIYFDPKNESSLVDVLSKAIENKIDWSIYKQKGFENYKRFSWQKCADDTLSLYKEILAQSNQSV